MDHAARGGHPLHAARAKIADVAEMIAMLHAAIEHVGHGLETAMRMRREARNVVAGIIGAELVEHQERIQPQARLAAEAAAQFYPRAVARRDRGNDLLQCAGGHGASPEAGLKTRLFDTRTIR